MRIIGSVLAISCASWLSAGYSFALSVDEIIKLKRGGVADSTIELLINRGDDARAAGVWKQDGWILHSTPSRERRDDSDARYGAYPLYVYPRVFLGRR